MVTEKRVYISADYDATNGDTEVVDVLNGWAEDDSHKVEFVDMAAVKSGSVSRNPDCRICDLKREFNKQINASSAVIIVVGDKTASRTAGCACQRNQVAWNECKCTPYKQNVNGPQQCTAICTREPNANEDFGEINQLSYLQHEFEQAHKKEKPIIIVYNSLRKEPSWLPTYLKDYEDDAVPFWIINDDGKKKGNYNYIKEALGYV